MEEKKDIPQEQVKNDEPKKDRFTRRLEAEKKAILDKLVFDFFVERSACKDPQGEEAAAIFDKYNNQWKAVCTLHNKRRVPFKLRYQAFSESAEQYIKNEEQQKIVTAQANKLKDFPHWYRRSHLWKTRPLSCIWFQIKVLFNQKKYLSLWQEYYKNEVVK